ncbi:hypothetical protein MtrunA17_Chr1g0206711 [Medicago truncatula]|uniref:Uncharacterized protein n=1 Tax=Medicago truncatula TaxID=3880 RepID=A0A396K993_MEDTR|nr:hypothetical protein MtrunA17_Chr1g0206711 [Medicago truncatula]
MQTTLPCTKVGDWGVVGHQVYINANHFALSTLNNGLSTLRGARLALEGVNRLFQLLEHLSAVLGPKLLKGQATKI